MLMDYTTWNMGRRAGTDGKIGKCAKCGRKGAVARSRFGFGKYEERGLTVSHVVQVLTDQHALGIPVRRILDSCFIPDTK